MAPSARTSAGSITTAPSLRKCQLLTVIFSRRKAISHRMVASEPVTERLGPRSMPISSALVTGTGTCAA